jgi:hypothetical protein
MATQILNGIQQVQQGMDRFNDDLGEMCAISEFVEDGYIGNASAPTDESEYSLSPDMQKANVEKRKQRAKNVFASLRTQQTGGHVLECFADSGDLPNAMQQFQSLQASPQYKSIFVDGKLKTVQQTLVFHATYLQKGLTSMAEQIQKPKEGFWDGADVTPSVALQTLQSNMADLDSVHALVAQHASAIQVMKQKQKATESGNDATSHFESAPPKLPETVYS